MTDSPDRRQLHPEPRRRRESKDARGRRPELGGPCLDPAGWRPPARDQARAGPGLKPLALILALTLAACGKVGAPNPPPDADAAYPRTYPPPDSVVPGDPGPVPRPGRADEEIFEE